MNKIQKTLGFLKLQYACSNIDDYDSYVITNGNKPTETELNLEYNNVLKLECKDEAKKRIAFSDWSVLQDVNISNKQEFINYRSTLRNLILNPVENPIFPVEPTPIWIS